jgi:hypothetical protein
VDADGNIDCDYYGCSSALTADDVANGICHYDSTGRALQEATNDQIEFFGAGDEPFREVCAHWSKETHTLMESVTPPPLIMLRRTLVECGSV